MQLTLWKFMDEASQLDVVSGLDSNANTQVTILYSSRQNERALITRDWSVIVKQTLSLAKRTKSYACEVKRGDTSIWSIL